MKWFTLLTATLVISGCTAKTPDLDGIREAQANSVSGKLENFEPNARIPKGEWRKMRDRAYGYCLTAKTADLDCTDNQDVSLIMYSHAFIIVESLKSQDITSDNGFVVAHKLDSEAFKKILAYCNLLYTDHGSADARMLGPCISAGLGADYFTIIPVN